MGNEERGGFFTHENTYSPSAHRKCLTWCFFGGGVGFFRFLKVDKSGCDFNEWHTVFYLSMIEGGGWGEARPFFDGLLICFLFFLPILYIWWVNIGILLLLLLLRKTVSLERTRKLGFSHIYPAFACSYTMRWKIISHKRERENIKFTPLSFKHLVGEGNKEEKTSFFLAAQALFKLKNLRRLFRLFLKPKSDGDIFPFFFYRHLVRLKRCGTVDRSVTSFPTQCACEIKYKKRRFAGERRWKKPFDIFYPSSPEKQ